MSLMPTAPRSIGGVLDQAIRLYRHALVPCLPVVLIAVVLMIAMSLLLFQGLQAASAQAMAAGNPRAVLAVFASPRIWLAYLVLVVVMTAVYGALFARIDAIARGERLTLGQVLGIGLRRAPTTIGVGVLFMLMIAVGMALLLIPGIYLWGVFQLAVVPPIVERAGVFESLGISRRLTRGNWWRTTAIIFVAFVIMYVLVLVAGIIVGMVAAMSAGAAGLAAHSTGVQLGQQILSGVLNLFMMTFLPCVLLAVYYDLKLRKEGADLAGRVDALKPAN